MTPQDYIRNQALKYAWNGRNDSDKASDTFTSGAELMLDHVANIIKFINQNGYLVDMWTPEKLIAEYFKSIEE